MRSGVFSPQDILSRLQMISVIFSRIEAMSLEYQRDDFTS